MDLTVGAADAARVGREAEQSAVERFLAAERRPGALVLAGEPGIGKTTLWALGVENARARGYFVLSARASASEARLAFAVLADLLEGVSLTALQSLPEPQLHALEVAVLRSEPVGGPPEPLAISAGFLGTLRLLAATGPVLVAIDDVQAVDAESGEVLGFAGRRIGEAPVRFLFSRPTGRRSDLEGVLELSGLERVDVGPLTFGAISHLLTRRLKGCCRDAFCGKYSKLQGGTHCSRWSLVVRSASAVFRRSGPSSRCRICSKIYSGCVSRSFRRSSGERSSRWR